MGLHYSQIRISYRGKRGRGSKEEKEGGQEGEGALHSALKVTAAAHRSLE